MEFAAIKHQGQWRKHPLKQIPYIEHPAHVGLMLERAGYDEETVAAGILHDVVEDCGVTLEELKDAFGERVARLVDMVSEPPKSVDWQERKAAYREKLASADKEAVAIAAADHLHNLNGLARAYMDSPTALDMFKTSMDEKFEHERLCAEIFDKRLGDSLSAEFRAALEDCRATVSV